MVNSLMLFSGGWAVAGNPSSKGESEPPSPPLELLEFLGSWVTDDGDYVDPEALRQLGLAQIARKPDNADDTEHDDE